ncbi:hypothetical protein INR49_017489 [Caranx melampygus]|nr:hypothetical protein INR49_017489 [Caranx melampygus]
MESSIPVDQSEEEHNSTSDDPEEQSGHIHPAEIPSAEVITVSDDSDSGSGSGSGSGSSIDVPVIINDPVTLVTSPASVTSSPPSTEVDSSSPEIITLVPESNASSGAEHQEVIQEGLGHSSEIFLSTAQNVAEGAEPDDTEGSGESSGESSGLKPELLLTNPTVSSDHTSEGTSAEVDTHEVDTHDEVGTGAPPPSDIKITLIPHLTLTPGWEPEPSYSTPQESRSDREYSAETPVTEESEDDSTEQEVVLEITTRSINDHRSEAGEVASSTDEPSVKMCTWRPDEDDASHPTDSHDITLAAPTVHPEGFHRGEEELTAMSAAKVSIIRQRGDAEDSCLENPCLNGGTCVDGESTRCICLPGYGGDLCQTGSVFQEPAASFKKKIADLELCEPGWEKFQGFCYRHFTKRQSWEAAEQHCRMCGGHLISVMTPEEQDYINSKTWKLNMWFSKQEAEPAGGEVSSLSPEGRRGADKYKEYQWIGLSDRTIEGDFLWSDGNPVYENWYKGQPDSYFLSGEDCAVMVWHDSGHWSDVPCNYHLSYTCKKGVSSCSEPPNVAHANVFGKKRSRYETNSKVRYYCEEGFIQKLNPVIKCLPGGRWEEPMITCSLAPPVEQDSVTLGPQQQQQQQQQQEEVEEVMEVMGGVTEKTTPLFWDIKWNV